MKTIFLLAAVLWMAQAGMAQEPGRRYLISFPAGTTAAQRSAAAERLGGRVVETLDAIDAAVVEVRPGRAVTLDAFWQGPGLLGAEEDVYRDWLSQAELPPLQAVLRALPRFTPARRGISARLPSWVNPAEVPWGVARVDAPAAWPVTEGEGVRVGVIDTGIDAAHPDLRANVAGGYNAIDPQKPYFDDNDHGTHVSGTIAAVLDGKGVVGVAPRARLYAIKVLDKGGGGRISTIVKGLIWAADHHMQVVNMSLGSPMGSLFLRLAIKYAHAHGVTVVAAAGNSGGAVGYPAAYSDAIAVSASDEQDKLASFSSRGPKVEFVAPGVDVKSTVPGGYDWYDGTSMATPHVTGLAALAIAHGVSGPDQVRSALRRAARPIGLPRNEEGYGMIDAALLVK